MANDQINQYPITAVTIEDESFFDIDQWTGAAFESQKVPTTLMASVFGVNIGNSDLQCTDPIRKLLLQGTDPDGVRFSVRNSADTIDFFKVAGGGIITFNEAFSFPLVDGGVGEVLTTDGAGNVSWAAGGGADTNIGTDDLIISAAGTRYLKMAGAAVTDKFQLQHSGGTNLFWFDGTGGLAIGYLSDNTGAGTYDNVVIGTLADNNGNRNTTMVGRSAKGHGIGAVAVGYQAEAGLSATAIGYQADASAGQYNTSIGNAASCSFYYNVALGKDADAYNNSTALGAGAGALSEDSIAIGRGAVAPVGVNSKRSICIGRNASTTLQGSIALGYDTLSSGLGSIAVGSGIETTASHSITLGALAFGGE